MRTSPNDTEAITATAYARRLDDEHDPLSCELVPGFRLVAGDAVLCVAGDVVPASGVALDGLAAVRRPSGEELVLDARGAHRVAGGARLLRGWLVVRLDQAPR